MGRLETVLLLRLGPRLTCHGAVSHCSGECGQALVGGPFPATIRLGSTSKMKYPMRGNEGGHMRKAFVVAVGPLSHCARSYGSRSPIRRATGALRPPTAKLASGSRRPAPTRARPLAPVTTSCWGRAFLSVLELGQGHPGRAEDASSGRSSGSRRRGRHAADPQIAATIAVQLRSNKNVLAVNGFAGSQENVAGVRSSDRGGLSFVSVQPLARASRIRRPRVDS